MTSTAAASPRRFRAIVFKRAPSTSDFTCSERVALPGLHTEEQAWAAVRAALREGAIGGEVLPTG